MIRWVLTAGVLVVIAMCGLVFHVKKHEIAFDHLRDAKARLLGAGFHCISNRADGVLATGFLISRQSVSASDASTLRKVGPMGPRWKGKVWVTFSADDWRLVTLPEQAGVRVWGAVIAFGDEDLLREIDDSLTPSMFSFL